MKSLLEKAAGFRRVSENRLPDLSCKKHLPEIGTSEKTIFHIDKSDRGFKINTKEQDYGLAYYKGMVSLCGAAGSGGNAVMRQQLHGILNSVKSMNFSGM